MSTTDRVLRVLVAVDLLLGVLTFIPAFSGIGRAPGLADRLWGSLRVGGWRADVAWVCASSLPILVGGLPQGRDPGLQRITIVLCRLWLPCLLIYLGYVLMHMFG